MNRLLCRLVPPFVVLTLMLIVTAPGADALVGWCRKDPVVDIGGKRTHIWVASYEEINTAATGPTDVRITVPRGVSTELIRTDDGFGGHGETVSFHQSNDLRVTDRGIQIVVDVYVPATSTLPIRVEVTDRDDNLIERATGPTNQWVTVRTRV